MGGSDVGVQTQCESSHDPLPSVRLQTIESTPTSLTDGANEAATLGDEFHELWELQVGLLFPLDYDTVTPRIVKATDPQGCCRSPFFNCTTAPFGDDAELYDNAIGETP